MSKINNITYNGDVNALKQIAESANLKIKSATYNGDGLGKSISGVSKDAFVKMSDILIGSAFDSEIKRSRGESSMHSTAGINNSLKAKTLKNMATNAKAIAEGLSITSGVVNSHVMTDINQLQLISIIPSVIKPVGDKIVKSVVTKNRWYERSIEKIQIRDGQGKAHDYFDVLNNPEKILELNDGNQGRISLEIPVTSGNIENVNLLDLYAQQVQAKNPGAKLVNSIYDFIDRGLSITGVKIDGQMYPIDYTATGNAVQSGQMDEQVAALNFTLTPSDKADKEIKFIGSVRMDGDVFMAASENTVEAVVFEFTVPAKGAENAFTVIRKRTIARKQINNKAAGRTTVNQMLLDDYKTILDLDIINTFQQDVVKVTAAKKDAVTLKYINDHINTMKSVKQAAKSYLNETALNTGMDVYAYGKVDMTVQDSGYTDFLHGTSIALANQLFDSCNEIDKKLNPEQRQFSLYSSSAASKWLKDSAKEDVISFNLVGTALQEGELVNGISTPYSLQEVNIGGLYNGTYITSNKIESVDTMVKYKNKAGETFTGQTKVHKYRIIPRFEENLDTILFLHGLEYITNGVNDSEYIHDQTLQFEARFDITKYRHSIGEVDLVEAPRYSSI